MNTITFQTNLSSGRLAEGVIANWLRRRGNTVIPAYELESVGQKGPQVYAPNFELVAPDLLVWKDGKTCWIEAKSKSVFAWNRTTKAWVTGIDLHYYEQYQKVLSHFEFKWDVWLLFLHSSSIPSDADLRHGCPVKCPTGLFGNSLNVLRSVEHSRDLRWGRTGMVYWQHSSLKLLATPLQESQ